jgi:hypothetical protein
LGFFTDGQCKISGKWQIRCKKCRYDKCVSVGMDPKWVLSNDDKRIRFRNHNKRKSDQAKMANLVTLKQLKTCVATPQSSFLSSKKRSKTQPVIGSESKTFTSSTER